MRTLIRSAGGRGILSHENKLISYILPLKASSGFIPISYSNICNVLHGIYIENRWNLYYNMIKGGRQTQEPMESPGQRRSGKTYGQQPRRGIYKKTKSYLQAARGIEEFWSFKKAFCTNLWTDCTCTTMGILIIIKIRLYSYNGAKFLIIDKHPYIKRIFL